LRNVEGMIRVLLVDDQPAVRQGLQMRLALEPDVWIVGEAADGNAAVQMAELHHPDVIVMDIEMPLMDGLTATTILRRTLPRTSVVVLSLHDDEPTRRRALNAGACAFVAKSQSEGVLLDAIRTANA
jgi:DNA-binding NarL/FixJ family response regulator